MTRSPWLCAPVRYCNAVRQAVDLLKHIGNVEILLHPVPDALAEFRFHFTLNDKHHITEACPPGVKERKVNDDMSFRVDRLDLLEAAKAAAHARGHDHKSWFLSVHFFTSPAPFFILSSS